MRSSLVFCFFLLLVAMSLEAASVAEEIRQRADTLRLDGEWIGTFDQLIYAALRQRRVQVCFGTQVVDLIQLFAPWLALSSDSPLAPARFTGCVAYEDKLLTAIRDDGCFPKMNHWIIGVPIEGVCIDVVAEADALTEKATAGTKKYVDASLAASKAGWLVKPIAVDGNCGIDVMSYFDCKPRLNEVFSAIRNELADFMEGVADQELWQDCFIACAEGKPKKAAGPKKAAAPLSTEAETSTGVKS